NLRAARSGTAILVPMQIPLMLSTVKITADRSDLAREHSGSVPRVVGRSRPATRPNTKRGRSRPKPRPSENCPVRQQIRTGTVPTRRAPPQSHPPAPAVTHPPHFATKPLSTQEAKKLEMLERHLAQKPASPGR